MKSPPANRHETREGWLRAATHELRPYFASVGYPLPDNIRFAIAFTSTGRKGSRVGECWHSSNSADQFFEIFIRADLDDPIKVLSVLTKELMHTALPNDVGHGKQFREAAGKIGLTGPMRTAEPNFLLTERLTKLAGDLGALPHARLNINNTPFSAIAVDRPKKQKARMLKAWCGVRAAVTFYASLLNGSVSRVLPTARCMALCGLSYRPGSSTTPSKMARPKRAFKRSLSAYVRSNS